MTAYPPLDHAPRIVVAEDDVQLRKMVVAVLTQAGFEVLEAGHAEEALRVHCGKAEGVQVLFTDIWGSARASEFGGRTRQ
jgi:DNA-binding NtrC family response regulator